MEDSEPPYTRPKIVISGKYGIVNIDIKIKSGEPLTRVNHGCLHPIRDRCIVNSGFRYWDHGLNKTQGCSYTE